MRLGDSRFCAPKFLTPVASAACLARRRANFLKELQGFNWNGSIELRLIRFSPIELGAPTQWAEVERKQEVGTFKVSSRMLIRSLARTDRRFTSRGLTSAMIDHQHEATDQPKRRLKTGRQAISGDRRYCGCCHCCCCCCLYSPTRKFGKINGLQTDL